MGIVVHRPSHGVQKFRCHALLCPAPGVAVTITSIQNYEAGTIPKGDVIVRLAKALMVSTSWLLEGTGPIERSDDGATGPHDKTFSTQEPGQAYPESKDSEYFLMVPRVEARLAAGTGSFDTSQAVVGRYSFRADWLKTKGDPAQMVLMSVSGDSMEPIIKDGDMVLIDQCQREILPDKLYAVRIGEGIVIKQVDWGPKKLVLKSYNRSLYPPMEVDIRGDNGATVAIIGRIRWWCHEVP